MRALTLTQPWATLVAIGAKRFETRSWSTSYRGPLAIHAAKGYPKAAESLCYGQPFYAALREAERLGLGDWVEHDHETGPVLRGDWLPRGAAVTAGIPDTGLWHLPKLELPSWNGRPGFGSLLTRLQEGTGPATWSTLCELEGHVYAYAGVLRKRRLCAVCRERHRGDDWAQPLLGPLPPAELVNREENFWRRCKIRPAQARALHVVYERDGVGIARLADLYYERLGYRTPSSCASGIRNAFLLLELPVRTHAESERARTEAMRRTGFGGRSYDRKLTVETVDRLWRLYEAGHSAHEIARRFHTRLGYESPDKLRHAVEYAWKTQGRRLRSNREAELLSRAKAERLCQGVIDPKDGSRTRPCTQRPIDGGDYCFGHSPARKAERDALLARMQSRIQRAPTVAWALVRPHLGPLLEPRPDPRGRARVYETASGALARHTGVDAAICSRLLLGRQQRITVEKANRLLAPLGLTVDDLQPEAVAA